MDIFKGIGDFFGGLFGQKKKREDEQQQPQQQQSAVSFNSTPKLGDNFANNSSNPTQPQQPKEFAKSSVDLNPVKPVQPVQPQPQVNRDQERQQLANKYRQEETDRYNQGSDHAANFLNDIFSGGKTAQMRENTINQNIQNRVNAEMLRKYGPDDQQVKQNIAQTSQDISNKATSVNDFTKSYNNTMQQTVASPVSAVKGAANSVVETMPKVSGAVTELGANTIKLFDEDNQFANNLINRVRADREKNIVRKTLNSATGLTDQDNKMAYGLGSSGTRMAIDAAMTPVTGGAVPALVHGVEAHSEMMDSLDNIEARKKAEAAAKGEAYTPSSFGSRYLAATANAGAQAAIEKLGIDNVTGKIGGKFAKNMVGRAVTGALGEAGEEAAQQYAENFTKKLFDNKQNIHEGVAESALMGGIMGGAGKMAFGGMDAVKNPYDANNGKFNNYNPKSLIEAERNAVRTGIFNNHLAKRIGEGMSPESSAHIAADSIINPYSNVYAGTKSKNGYNRDHIHLVAAPNGDKYNSSTVSEFNGGLSLKNIAPRDISEIKKSQAMLGAPLVGHKPEGIGISSGLGDIAAPQGVRTNNIAQNDQKVNRVQPFEPTERTPLANGDRDFGGSFGNGFDPRGENSAVNKAAFPNDQKVNDSVKYRLPDDNSNLPEVNYTETEGTPIYRGQAQAGRGIIKNQTNFADSGNYENGAFFTDNLDTAHKYGDNILETRRNDKNTVSVQESDNLQAMANKRMDEIMRNPKLYDEMDEDEYDLLEQMALGRPEAFAQYTKKPFVETGDKFGESGEVVYFKGVDDDAGIIRFKQKAEAENLARVAKENLQARHQELTGDQSIAFNEWANELEHRAQGFFDEKTGKITINDGDLNTLNHELGHKLLTRADNRAELLADIRNTVGDEALNAKYGENYAQQVANMNPEERANLFAEEYLADGFSDYYNGILAGEDSQRLGAKLGIPPRVLATYDRIVEAIKGILGLQQDTLKQFYAQAETGKFAHNYKQNTSVYNESPVYKAAFPKVQKEDLATPELEKYGIKPTKTEYNQALEYILTEERPELFERYEKARLGLEALEENIDFNQFTPTELERLYGKNYAEHLDRGMISQMVRKNSLNGLDQAAMGGDIGEIDMEDYIDRLNHYYEAKREVKDLEQEIREAYADPELREEAKQALWFNKYEEIENAVANLRQNGVDIDFDGYVELKYGNKAKNEAVKIEEEPSSEDIIDENAKTDKNIVSEAPLIKETDQKTRKFAETVLDTDTPPKDFVKLMHAGDESLKYTPKKNSEMWSRATKSVQESPERVFNELENTRVANDETMAKGIALAKHYQAMGDDLKASELYVELAKKATEAGRTVQALNLMRRTTPEGVLMSTMREVESYNDKMKNKPNKQINITPEQRAEFLGKLREAYAMPEGN